MYKILVWWNVDLQISPLYIQLIHNISLILKSKVVNKTFVFFKFFFFFFWKGFIFIPEINVIIMFSGRKCSMIWSTNTNNQFSIHSIVYKKKKDFNKNWKTITNKTKILQMLRHWDLTVFLFTFSLEEDLFSFHFQIIMLHKHSCKREWFTYLTILIENTRVQTPYQNIQQCRDQKQDVQACLWYQRVLVITLLRNTNINLCKIHNTTVIRSFHQTQMANIH